MRCVVSAVPRMAQVSPFQAPDMTTVTDLADLSQGGIPLSALNPDLNGDGKIDDWEKEVYARIIAADTDHTGAISVRNLFDFIREMSNEVKEASKGGIPIKSLNPVCVPVSISQLQGSAQPPARAPDC